MLVLVLRLWLLCGLRRKLGQGRGGRVLLLLLLLVVSMMDRGILRWCGRNHGRLNRLLIGRKRHAMLLLLLVVDWRCQGRRPRRRHRRLLVSRRLRRWAGNILHVEVFNVVRSNLEALRIGAAVDPNLKDNAFTGHDGFDPAGDGIGRLLHAHKHHLAGPRVAVGSHDGSVMMPQHSHWQGNWPSGYRYAEAE